MEAGVLAGLDVPKSVQDLFSSNKFLGDALKVDSWEKDVNDEDPKFILESISDTNFQDESIFVAEGAIHHDYSLPMRIVSNEFKQLAASYSQLLNLVGEDKKGNVDFIEHSIKKTKNLLQTLCPAQVTGKRAIFTILIVGLITFVASVGTSTTIAYAAGAFNKVEPITKEVLKIQENINNLEDVLSRKVVEIIEALQIGFKSHLIAHDLEKAFEMVHSFIVVAVKPDEWDFTENSFLHFIQEYVAKSGQIQIGNKFGSHPTSTLLLLSAVQTGMFINSTIEEHGNCDDLSLVSSFKTVIPYGHAAKPTEIDRKFVLNDGKFIWISTRSFLAPTKFRPQNKLSWNRRITSDEHISSVYVVNNTLIIVEANITALMQCNEVQKQINIEGAVLVRIPLACQLTSDHLNISSYKVITLASKEVLTVAAQYPTLHYHQDLQNLSKIENLEEEELAMLMTKIIEEKKEIIDMERKVIEQDDGSGLLSFLSGLWSTFSNWASRFWAGLSQPIRNTLILLLACLVVLFLIFFLCCLNKRCK